MKRNMNLEINPGSMADIGFLLLIFFLVSTTIDVDKGILVKLPPLDEDEVRAQTSNRNICRILVNKDNELLVRNKSMQLQELKPFVKKFITNPNDEVDMARSPRKAIVSLQNDRGTEYTSYIEVYNEIKASYSELRNELSKSKYDISYEFASLDQRRLINDEIPMILSEADPTEF